MSDDVVSKLAFAALTNVHASRVSQWITRGQISGDAIVGEGRHARIRVPVAIEQLKRNLDVNQRTGANAKATLDFGAAQKGEPAAPTIEDELKKERLEQIQLQNERAREERAARAGVYMLADDARRQMGRVASELMTLFESSLPEFAAAIASSSNMTTRDALHLLRATWRAARERGSERETGIVEALPATIGDAADSAEDGGQAQPDGDEAGAVA